MACAKQSYENVSKVNVKEWLQRDICELDVPHVTKTNCQLIKTRKVIMRAEDKTEEGDGSEHLRVLTLA